MKPGRILWRIATIALSPALVLTLGACGQQATDTESSASQPQSQSFSSTSMDSAQSSSAAPQYRIDPFWPKPLPNNWIIGQVSGLAVDLHDHIWIVHRPRSLTAHEAAAAQNPPTADCCVPAPSIIEFDPEGNVVQAWGGPTWNQDLGEWVDPEDGWPANEHGLFVDHEDNLWMGGNGMDDHVVLKMSPSGERLLTIGYWYETGGSNDPQRLGRPADIAVDPETREVFVADGYLNHRIVVFDADTGEYKRHWGAYGERPDDEPWPEYDPEAEQFRGYRNPVHTVRLSVDGLLYMTDRTSNRIQVFLRDGTFMREAIIAPQTLDQGSAWDLALSSDPAQAWLFMADGHNKKIWVISREDLAVAGSFGQGGRQAGQFEWVHNIASDSRGNLYTAEVNTGKRIQKFLSETAN